MMSMADKANKATILTVEDNPNMLDMITFLLQEEGYRVLPANDGQAALSILEQAKPELIISDVMMPGMNGFDFCQRVRAQPGFSQIPFIFLTARSRRADIRKGMGLGADDYLTKPFEADELLSTVKVRLARAVETQTLIDRASADLQKKVTQALTHEFRTPLSLVVGYTELLESTGHDLNEGEFQAILQGLHAGSSRLMTLVEDFLLLSRLRTGDVAREIEQNQRKTIDPDEIVRRVAAEAEAKATSKNVVLLVNMGAVRSTVGIDQQDLAEIVERLVDNAIKFSKSAGGQVEITTSRDESLWALTITDQGVGIRPDAHEWIFEAFRQVDRDKMEQQGSGVGLTIVRGLAEAYGGRVMVESTPGQGSTFMVWLPLLRV
jgi:two-component system sensor histidine kinase/response regulator